MQRLLCSLVFFIVLVCAAAKTTVQREQARFRDCLPPGVVSPVELTYANILESKIVLGMPINFDAEGVFKVDASKFSAKLQVQRYDSGKWVEEANVGPNKVSSRFR